MLTSEAHIRIVRCEAKDPLNQTDDPLERVMLAPAWREPLDQFAGGRCTMPLLQDFHTLRTARVGQLHERLDVSIRFAVMELAAIHPIHHRQLVPGRTVEDVANDGLHPGFLRNFFNLGCMNGLMLSLILALTQARHRQCGIAQEFGRGIEQRS